MSQRIDESLLDFSYCHLDLKKPLPRSLYWSLNSTYKLWKANWTNAFQHLKKLESDQTLTSDNFTRQDDIVALHVKDTCIATVGFRVLDMRFNCYHDDSYLELWPKDFIRDTLGGKQVLIMSGYTIHPDFRLKIFGVPTMHLLMGFGLRFFKESRADYLITIVRNDVGINKLVYLYGAHSVARDLPFNNTKVDLTYFVPSETQAVLENKYSERIQEILLTTTKDNKGESYVYTVSP